MPETHFLLSDPTLPQAEIQQAIGRENQLSVFDYRQQFSAQIADESSALAHEIRPLLDKGDTIPKALIDRFLQLALNDMASKNIVLTGFPKSLANFEFLCRSLAKVGRKINKIWYFAHANRDAYIANYALDANHRLWHEKFGHDLSEKWQVAQKQTDLLIESIRQVQPNISWEIIQLDYSGEMGQTQPEP